MKKLVYSTNSELDLKSLILLFWRGKVFIILMIMLSLAHASIIIKRSVMVFKAESVIEPVNNDTGSRRIPAIEQSSIASIFLGTNNSSTDNKVIPTIMGREFLTTVLKSEKINYQLRKECYYSNPSIFSIPGILSYLNLVVIDPSEEQKENKLVDCLKDMLSIEPYKYKTFKTKAIKVSVEHSDPFFAAELNNEIVSKYFEEEEKKRIKDFKMSLNFLSEEIANATIELNKVRRDIDNFIISNAFVPNNSGEEDEMAIKTGAFLKELAVLKERAGWVTNDLSTLDSLNYDVLSNKTIDIENFSKPEQQFSSSFLGDLKAFTVSKSRDPEELKFIKEKINSEAIRMKALLGSIDNSISSVMSKINADLKVAKSFETLKKEEITKKVYLKSLNSAAKERRVEAEMASLVTNEQFSKAVPPLYPSKPRSVLIIGVTGVIYSFVSLGLLLLFQLFRGTIHREETLEQTNISGKVKYLGTQMQLNKILPELDLEDTKFYNIKDVAKNLNEKKCLFLLVNDNKRMHSVVNNICLAILKLLQGAKNKVLYVQSNSENKNFDMSRQSDDNWIPTDASKSFVPSEEKIKRTSLSNIFIGENFFDRKIKRDLEQFDSIIFSGIGFQNQLDLITVAGHVDSVVLFGKLGSFSLKDLNIALAMSDDIREKLTYFLIIK